jgi:hypothetical protein
LPRSGASRKPEGRRPTSAEAKRATGATAAIGFAAAVQAAPDPAGFWRRVRDRGGADFAAALDYAGLDVYVDVFGPRVGVERVAEVVGWVLRDDYSPKPAFGVLRDLIAELRQG